MMVRGVTDDNRHRADRCGPKRGLPALVYRTGLFLVLLVAAGPALAQGTAPPGQLRAVVHDLADRAHQVSVPLHQSVIVETSIEVNRVDVIADQIADVRPISPRQLLLTGKSYGRTSIVLWGPGDQQYMLEVSVQLDLRALNRALSDVDPLSDVEANAVLGHIVLTGTVSGAETARRMMDIASLFVPVGVTGAVPTIQNHMDISGEQQVLLRCIVAEVNRSAVRQLGVNGFLAGENGTEMFVINQIAGINPINIGAAAGAIASRPFPFLTGENGIPNGSASTLSLGFPRAQAQLFIRAMADNGLLRLLAEPNLVAISGETASFLAGGEFPIPVPQGLDQVTIEFREFGVRLNFTPVVRAHQRIRLRVAPEVSELDFANAVQIQGFTVPGLTTRNAETTIEVGSGQTIAIAGLLSEQVRGLVTRIPGIGDVPIIGALFRSVEYRRSMTELVILVTPEIIAPMHANQVAALPGHSITSPGDLNLYGLGWLEGPAKEDNTDGRNSRAVRDHTVRETAFLTDPHNLSVHGPWGYAGLQDLR